MNPNLAISGWTMRFLLVASLLCLSAGAAHAGSSITQLLKKTGLDRQLQQNSQQEAEVFVQQFEESSQLQLGPDFAEMVSRSLSEYDLFGQIAQSLEGDLSRRDIRKLARWYDSSLGKKITELEVTASDLESIAGASDLLNELLADQATVERAQRLIDLLDMNESSMHSLESVQMAIIDGMLGSEPEFASQKAAIYADLKQQLDNARPGIEQLNITVVAYVYRSLSNAEYDKYLRFLSQSRTRRFNKLLLAAMTSSSKEIYQNLGRNIGEYLAHRVPEQYQTSLR